MRVDEKVKSEIEKKDYLKVPELSRLLNVTPEYIYTLLRRNELDGFRVGTEWRIPSSSVISFLERCNKPKRKKIKKDTAIVIAIGIIGMVLGSLITLLLLLLIRG